MSLNSFRGLHAEHYDLVYADKPYAAEARFVHDQLIADGGAPTRLLDVACGTGRHARELHGLGWEVTGVDFNPELVERARAGAAEHGVAIDFYLGDMRAMEVPAGGPFGAVTCLFDSIGYPLTNEGVVAALSSIARHLAEDGTAVIEFLHAPAMLHGASDLRVRSWPLPSGGELLRIAHTRLDVVAGAMHVAYDVMALEADGTYRRTRNEQSNRFFAVEEMRALLEAAGMAPRRFIAAYADDPAVGAETFHVLAVAGR